MRLAGPLAAALLAACAAPRAPVSRFATLDGMRIHYVDGGRDADALVFVHGWAGDHAVWRSQIDAFGDTRVLAVDLPGHGRSASPRTEYTVDLLARAVAAVMDDAKVRRATLVGHSNGVAVVRGFHRMHPERTRALVAVEGPLRAMLPAEAVESFAASLEGPDGPARLEALVDGMLPAHWAPDLRAGVRADMLATPLHVLVSSLRGANDPAAFPEDPIEVPLLAVLARSPFWTDEYEAFVRRLAPRVEYVVLDGASHFLMLDRPQEFNALLKDFLAAQVRP